MIKRISLLVLLTIAIGVFAAASATRLPRARIVFDVYVDGDGRSRDGIYTMRPDGSARTRLTAGAGSLPKWSPGHEFIAYTRHAGDEQYLHVMTGEGEDDHRIARISNRMSYRNRYSWSPDGSLIAFQALADDGFTSDIFVASPDGDYIRDVTARPGTELEPSWSPDGQRLAFVGLGVADLDSGGAPDGIFTINIDGSDLQQVTSSEGDFEPVWSPDGTKIAFSSYCPDFCGPDRSEGPYSSDLFVIEADGTNERRLTEDCHWKSELQWLIDGSGIVYSAWDDDDGCFHARDAEIRLVRLDGTEFNLTQNRRADFTPSISPNGRWLVYQSEGIRKGDYDTELYALSLKSGSRMRLTSNGARVNDSSPDW